MPFPACCQIGNWLEKRQKCVVDTKFEIYVSPIITSF
jgi:hypothetical protein